MSANSTRHGGDPLGHAASGQAGISLPITLVILVVVTLIGLAAINSVTVQQRLTANFYDREIAFQSAEAGLAAGAAALQSGTATNIRVCGLELGQGGTVCVANPFEDAALSAASIKTVENSSSGFTLAANAASSPQYVIERMGSFYNPVSNTGFSQTANSAQYNAQGTSALSVYYRITARSGDPSVVGSRAVVHMQAVYRQ